MANGNNISLSELSLGQEASALVAQYKNIIREQDSKIQTMNEKSQQLQDENKILKVPHIYTHMK